MMAGEAKGGRIALVTGAAQGLGAGIARALHGAGHRVALADVDTPRVAETAAVLGEGAIALTCDVASRDSIAAAVLECESRLGPVDILVNNAGVTRAKDFFDLTVEDWDEVMAVNLRSVFLASQIVAPGMMERGWGRIINLASLAGQRGGPQVQGAHYATSKSAITGLTRYMAYIFAPNGVTVNAIAPGPIHTAQVDLVPKDKLAMLEAQIPTRRIGRPEEVGALAVWLASEEAGFVTGTTNDINGGFVMR